MRRAAGPCRCRRDRPRPTATHRTCDNTLRRCGERCAKRPQQRLFSFHQVQCRAPRRTRSQPRQLGEKADQPFDIAARGRADPVMAYSERQLHAGRQLETAGQLAHLFRDVTFDLVLASLWAATIRSSSTSRSDSVMRLSSIVRPRISPCRSTSPGPCHRPTRR